MSHRIKFLFSLSILLIWCILIGIPHSNKDIITAFIVLIVTLVFTSYLNILPRSIKLKFIPTLIYFFWLIKEVYKSSFEVIKIIWGKKQLESGFKWIDSNQQDNLGVVIYSNSITLTPGTTTALVKDDKILVHALDKSSIEDLKKGVMSKKVKKILC